MSPGRFLRKAAYRWHCLAAQSETFTRLYVSAIAAIARNLGPAGSLMEWSVTGQNVAWKPVAFPPRRVTVGERTAIVLRPHLGEFDQAALFTRRLGYEEPVFIWLERYAASRYDAVVEIGANVGVYSVFFDALIKSHPKGKLRHVYSFEPSSKAYARLSANLKLNDTRYVSAFAAAISDKTGFSPFYEPEGHLTNGSLSQEFAAHFSPDVRSSTAVTLAGPVLAELFAAHSRVLLKIDAEGCEHRILAAMASIIESHAPDLLLEVLAGAEDELNAVSGLAGYQMFLLTPDGPVPRDAFKADAVERDWLLTRFPEAVLEGIWA
jgi:FkbM family methyltransferase